jgi:hypothetical protein
MGKLERIRVLHPIQTFRVSGSVIVLYLSQSVTAFVLTAVIYRTLCQRLSLFTYIERGSLFAYAKEWEVLAKKNLVKQCDREARRNVVSCIAENEAAVVGGWMCNVVAISLNTSIPSTTHTHSSEDGSNSNSY